MRFNYYEIVCIISIVLLGLLTAFLLTHRKGRKLSNRILAVFLIAQLFAIVDLLCFHLGEYTYTHFPYLCYVGFPFRFLWAPTLFIYTKSLTSAHYRITPKRLLHALPFLIVLFGTLFTFHVRSMDAKRFMLERHYLVTQNERYVLFSLIDIQILCYIFASLIVLFRYRKDIKMVFSSLERINLSWLKLILYGYTLSWISSLLVVFQLYSSKIIIRHVEEINITAFLLFFNIIVYKGLTQPEIFLDPLNGLKKRSQALLPDETSESYKDMLLRYMEESKPHLNSELTIKDLSENLSIPSRHVSQVINEKLHKNFFDFVSDYRISEAKKMLSNPAFQNRSILEILYDAGFNSKSSFNSLFKRKTGKTPSEFRKKERPPG